jgi:tRNA(Ile)-lysidine synthase
MASSRKSQQSPNIGKRIAVALSGGLDSVVLLDTVCKAVAHSQTEVFVFHVHHGLQKLADEWLVFCERLAKHYQVPFDFRLLHLDQSQGNIEARARAGRYEALANLCEDHDVEDLLLAHHQNDQAETVLLQLLRGAGVAGLSGMPELRSISRNSKPITIWRPLLNQSRAELEAYAKEHRLQWIEDPSNRNRKYRRNAIRKDIIPKLEKIQPQAVANIARSANLLSDTQVLLDRLAIQDGQDILLQASLKVKPLLSKAKTDMPAANNILRYWLKQNHLAMPSQERLDSWWRDLNSVRADAQLTWVHDEQDIRLWRGELHIVPQTVGRWVFKAVKTTTKKLGLPAAWIKKAERDGVIEYRARSGSEKIQIKPNSPRKTLKNLFQEADIPPWQRNASLLFIDGQLVAVAGIGVSHTHLVDHGARVWPEWIQES